MSAHASLDAGREVGVAQGPTSRPARGVFASVCLLWLDTLSVPSGIMTP